jgi:ATP-binding cassette subfamily G (WHITE) protein 2 (SNQ2)
MLTTLKDGTGLRLLPTWIEFATPWLYQMKELFIREASSYWRDPTYLIAAKIALNVLAGLFVGFTFYQSKDTQQGTQNKLFVSFSSFLSPCRY